MKKILLLANLNKDNLAKLEEALVDTGLKYEVSLKNQMLAVHGDNDDLYRARVALLAQGFIIK